MTRVFPTVLEGPRRGEGVIYCSALTPRGAKVASLVAQDIGGTLFLPRYLADDHPGAIAISSIGEFFKKAFRDQANMVCVMACGIVVRSIAPYLRSKTADPAVVVVDEARRYAISLVSGHLGGANALARGVAECLGAEPVITTATDVNGLPALDEVARVLNMDINPMEALKSVHMALLSGKSVRVKDSSGILMRFFNGAPPKCLLFEEEGSFIEGNAPTGLDVLVTTPLDDPDPILGSVKRAQCLILRPRRVYCVGVGCNRGTQTQEIVTSIEEVFKEHELDMRLLAVIASIDAKRDEKGLIEAARTLSCPIVFFSKEALKKVHCPNPSSAAMMAVGTPSVSEAASILATRGKGELLVQKQKKGNCTVAVSVCEACVNPCPKFLWDTDEHG